MKNTIEIIQGKIYTLQNEYCEKMGLPEYEDELEEIGNMISELEDKLYELKKSN